MKLDSKIIDVQGGFGLQTYESTISSKNAAKLWGMFENPYKNSIGSIVREISSNCWDSHVEAGVTDAIRIKYGKDESGFYVSFIDVGLGMSPKIIFEVYKDYLESTKETSNDVMGAFGIGSKSPLSYQSSFYINTRYDNVEYKYIMVKGETSPTIDLIDEEYTSERNGTEIKLYIKDEKDLLKFLQESYNQLYYFENVVFDLAEIEQLYPSSYTYGYSHISSIIHDSIKLLKQDFHIVQGNNFKVRTNGNVSELHLCIGNVKYPIDWTNLGISRISLPVALDFNIGDLSIIYTREDIRYTEENIKKIKSKIEALKVELIDKYNSSSHIEYDNYFKFISDMQSGHIDLVLNRSTQYEIIMSMKNILSTSELNQLKPSQLKGFPYQFKDRSDINDVIYHLQRTGLIDDKLFSYKLDKKFRSNGNMSGHTKSTYWKSTYIDNIITSYDSLHSSLTKLVDFRHKLKNSSSTCKLFRSKSKNYSVKKNRYIFEELYPNVYSDNTFIFTDFKLNTSVSFLKNYLKAFSSVPDNETAINILNYYLDKFKEIYDDILEDYDAIKVDEVWWKNKLKESRKDTVDYDRSLMAIDRIHYKYGLNYDRKDYRPDLDTYVNKQHNLRIIIDKSSDDIKHVSSSNNFNTLLEDLLVKTNQLYKNNFIKRHFEIHVMSSRNYNKVLTNRNVNSNIFTVNEFRNNKMIQTKILGKVYTIAKISKEFNGLLYNFCNNRLIDTLFNDNLVKEYKEIVDQVQTYNNWNRIDQFEAFIKDCDNINSVTELYDKELISKFNKIIVLFTEHNIHLYEHEHASIYLFMKNFKMSSTYYRFKEKFYNPLDTIEDILLATGYKQLQIDEYKIRYDDNTKLISHLKSNYATPIETKVLLNKYEDKMNNKQFKIESND